MSLSGYEFFQASEVAPTPLPLDFCRNYRISNNDKYLEFKLFYIPPFIGGYTDYEGDPETLLNVGLISPRQCAGWMAAWKQYDMSHLTFDIERIMQNCQCLAEKVSMSSQRIGFKYATQYNTLFKSSVHIFADCPIETQILIGLLVEPVTAMDNDVPKVIRETSLILHAFMDNTVNDLSEELKGSFLFNGFKNHQEDIAKKKALMDAIDQKYHVFEWCSDRIKIDPILLFEKLNLTLYAHTSLEEYALY